MIGTVARLWRDWRATLRSSLDAIVANEVGGPADDLRVSVADLRELAGRGWDSADLLLRKRMQTMALDPKEFSRQEPAVFRELMRLCTLCKSKSECALCLAMQAGDPSWVGWQDCCPNNAVLKMFSVLERCRPTTRQDGEGGRDLAPR